MTRRVELQQLAIVGPRLDRRVGKIKLYDQRGHGGCGAGAGRRAVVAVAGAYAVVERTAMQHSTRQRSRKSGFDSDRDNHGYAGIPETV